MTVRAPGSLIVDVSAKSVKARETVSIVGPR
jgi:hypothetical protein